MCISGERERHIETYLQRDTAASGVILYVCILYLTTARQGTLYEGADTVQYQYLCLGSNYNSNKQYPWMEAEENGRRGEERIVYSLLCMLYIFTMTILLACTICYIRYKYIYIYIFSYIYCKHKHTQRQREREIVEKLKFMSNLICLSRFHTQQLFAAKTPDPKSS